MIHSVAFAELLVYIEEELNEHDTPIMKLADLITIWPVISSAILILDKDVGIVLSKILC